MLMVTSSGTSAPRSMYCFASKPSDVSFFRFSLKMSPEETCGKASVSLSMRACVPLPAPGAPSITTKSGWDRNLVILPPDEAFIVTHEQLRFKLFHRVQHYADNDQQTVLEMSKVLLAARLPAPCPRTRCTNHGRMATPPKKSAPTNVILDSTRLR